MGDQLFSPQGQHPRSASSSLEAALKVARDLGAITDQDGAAVGLARQTARALDDAVQDRARPDTTATMARAHLACLQALALTPQARQEREQADQADLAGLMARMGAHQ